MRVKYVIIKVGKWDVCLSSQGYVTVSDDKGNKWFFFSHGGVEKSTS